MLTPERAQAIYRDYQTGKGKVTMTSIARRYGIYTGTVMRVITAQHRHTQHLPPLEEPHHYR